MNNDKPLNIETKVRRKNGKVHINISFDVEESRDFGKSEIKARLEHTTPWMIEHLYSWADFDHFFSINLFVDALHNLGKGLLRWDNCVLSQSNGRRCLTASAMLKKAYNYESWNDKSYRNWASRNSIWWKKLQGTKKGLSQMMTDHIKDNVMGMDKEEYSQKMWKLIHKRQEKVKKELKESAWKYIHKYIEHFWD